MTQFDAICKALEARGEIRVEGTSRRAKFTRTWAAIRNPDGTLKDARIVKSYWFVGKAGSLRMGRNLRDSTSALPEAKRVLIEEGKNAAP